ncbi:hypothetical protein NUH86_15475 [Sphingobium sp. JS3065]|uniref:hypothetical protein n=1 Tax=Sphingobium sp. JS3065 TaxID=2970925 RepID=UPI0022650E60|nr:hypothetical protein [Sphingobium sp. JS3065]UZW54861.1 hypothetical protein NUH86_15475 [Sphingobium sp. JS3065]
MVYVNEEDRQRISDGEEAVRALAKMGGWATQPCDGLFPQILSQYRHSERAGLVLGHWRREISLSKLIEAVRQIRTDILILEPGRDTSGRKTYYLSLILARAGEVRLHRGLRLWSADFDSLLWVVADPRDRDLDPCFFSSRATGFKEEAGAPFGDPVSAETGLRIADLRWVAEIGGHFV